MKRLTCTLATLAMVMWTYVPAKAEFNGTLPNDQEITITVINTLATTTAVTIYFVDKRGLDVIGNMTVKGTNPTSETFPKPGRGVRRVIIQIDPSHGTQTVVAIGGAAAQTIEAGIQLLHDVL